MSIQFLQCSEARCAFPALVVPAKCSHFSGNSVAFLGYGYRPKKLNFEAGKWRNSGAVKLSVSETIDTVATDDALPRWVLEPVGNGDFKHIGYKILLPGAFEIAADVVTIGRTPEKADVVIAVPTVSGLHARIERSEGTLLVTDLDSTNGTFIGDKRLPPGVPSAASPGDLITFGDANLAIFRLNKLEKQGGS